MKFNLYNDVKRFYHDVYDGLKAHESQNMILMGNVKMGFEGKITDGWRNTANWVMATVTNDEKIVLTALMTPPFGFTLYATDNVICEDAITCFVDGLITAEIPVPGVMSEKELAQTFTKIYTEKLDLTFEVRVNLRIYELSEVNSEIPQIGEMRLIEEKDMGYFPYWVEDMHTVAFGTQVDVSDDAGVYLNRIQAANYFVLEIGGVPVSMANISREMEDVCGIAMVYTPPYFRGRGYASASVAKLSQIGLDRGFKKCALYTDLSNPTSNSIYQKIGYVPLCDSVEIKFLEV